jgi:hypothetical protein
LKEYWVGYIVYLDRVFGVFLQGLEQDGNVHLVGLHQVLFHILVPFLIDETSFEDFVLMGKYGCQEVDDAEF